METVERARVVDEDSGTVEADAVAREHDPMPLVGSAPDVGREVGDDAAHGTRAVSTSSHSNLSSIVPVIDRPHVGIAGGRARSSTSTVPPARS